MSDKTTSGTVNYVQVGGPYFCFYCDWSSDRTLSMAEQSESLTKHELAEHRDMGFGRTAPKEPSAQ